MVKNLYISVTSVLVEEQLLDPAYATLWAIVIGNVAAFIAYPLDTARRRMILDCGREIYKSEWGCIITIAREEGVTALWAGVTTCIVRNVAFSVCRNAAWGAVKWAAHQATRVRERRAPPPAAAGSKKPGAAADFGPP